jgi:hypothetical protein
MTEKTLSFVSESLVAGIEVHLGDLQRALREKGVTKNGQSFDEHYKCFVNAPEFHRNVPKCVGVGSVGGAVSISISLFQQPELDVLIPRYTIKEAIGVASGYAYELLKDYVKKSEWDAYVPGHCRIVFDGEEGERDVLAENDEAWDQYTNALRVEYHLAKRRALAGLRVEQRYCVTKEMDGMVPAGAIARIQSINIANYDASGNAAPIQIHFSHLINQPDGERHGSYWFSEEKAKEICTLQVLD